MGDVLAACAIHGWYKGEKRRRIASMDTSKAANDGRLKSGQRKAAGTGLHGSGDSRVSMTVGLLSVFSSVVL